VVVLHDGSELLRVHGLELVLVEGGEPRRIPVGGRPVVGETGEGAPHAEGSRPHTDAEEFPGVAGRMGWDGEQEEPGRQGQEGREARAETREGHGRMMVPLAWVSSFSWATTRGRSRRFPTAARLTARRSDGTSPAPARRSWSGCGGWFARGRTARSAPGLPRPGR